METYKRLLVFTDSINLTKNSQKLGNKMKTAKKFKAQTVKRERN